MKEINIINYSVRGIKNLDEWIVIPFYKKVFDKNFNIKKYNVKGIYGANGAGKSAIISSLKILRNLITDPYYLSNNRDQEKIAALINRRTNKLEISVQFLTKEKEQMKLYEYMISVANENGRCNICKESLSGKNAMSYSTELQTIYSVEEGILSLPEENEENKLLIELTRNLLKDKSLPSIFIEKVDDLSYDLQVPEIVFDTFFLVLFGASIFVFLDKEDQHEEYYRSRQSILSGINKMDDLLEADRKKKKTYQPRGFFELSAEPMEVLKSDLPSFQKTADQLFRFLQIFKNDLRKIEIEKREDRTSYHCTLKMIYDDYSIDAEFESSGIKKLIRLFAYIQKMADGNIVFIDEFDSNLHDVYLCALLEYMMNYGKGQLCFTSHNIGPMDVLRKNKMSIHFVSSDHKVYSWTNNGNYSPSRLYRNGMITGSPFNVNDFDFISVFESGEEWA